MVKLDKISHHIALPDGVIASLDGDNVTIAKEGNSVSREFRHPRLEVRQVDRVWRYFVIFQDVQRERWLAHGMLT